MNYRNSELRLDQIVTYLNEEKINLSPVFQRGHVWPLKVRQKLIKNILQGKPIPAVFLYKEPAGSKYSYNILDGKQRLESIILFISNERADWQIPQWKRYCFAEKLRKDAGFQVEKKDFASLDDPAIRELREYSIPTIEITLNDESTLDDMISLFVDINQYGVKVNRFDIVKAMGRNDALLMDVFGLIAQEQRRGGLGSLPIGNLVSLSQITQLAALVHIARLATYKSFVYLNWAVTAAELSAVSVLQGQAQSLQHKPRGLLADSQSLPEFIATDSVLAVHNHPKSRKPLRKAQRGILKDRTDLDAELLPAFLTLPALLAVEPVVFLVSAGGTLWLAVGPAQLSHSINAHLFIAVEIDGFLQGLWLLYLRCHKSRVAHTFWLVKLIIANLFG